MSNATSPISSGDGRASPEVPGFDLIRPIGKGGFGEVWLAVNRATGRLRAVKIIAAARSGTVERGGDVKSRPSFAWRRISNASIRTW